MKEEKSKIVLIASDDNDRTFYKSLLSSYEGITIEDYVTINQFKESCVGKLYSGVIVDTKTRISSTTLSKKFFYTLSGGLPVMQINRSREDLTSINCLFDTKQIFDLKGENLLDHFIKNECIKVIPRRIRTTNRKNIFFNVQLFLKKNDEPIKTNMLDVSADGCFILSTEEKQRGEKIWFIVNELPNKTPICSKIEWIKLLGTEPGRLPGFGVSFEQISEAQIVGIMEAQEKKPSM